MKRWVIFVSIILLFSLISADEVGVNPGGGISPIGDLGNPAQCTALSCSGLGYTCGEWNDGCGGVLNCGVCSSGYSCSSGTCVAGGVTPPPGGGGTIYGGILNGTIEIFPVSFNLKMAINTNQKGTIRIINHGNNSRTLSIYQTGLDDKIIISNNSLTINAGETKNVDVIFVAPGNAGKYNGTISVGGFLIPVILDVKTKLLLFDSNIVVLNKNYQVSRGGTLRTKVSLVPMGDEERLDVQLNYAIKDSSGKIYLTQSETVLVEKKTDLKKNFNLGDLPLGEYIVSLELVYPGGVAPSSSYFKIVEKTPVDILTGVIFYIFTTILVVSILIIFIILNRKISQTRTAEYVSEY